MGAPHKCVYLYVWFGLVEESQSGVTAAVWSQRDEGLQSLQTQAEVGSPETKQKVSLVHTCTRPETMQWTCVRVWFGQKLTRQHLTLYLKHKAHTHTHWLLKDYILRNQSAWGCNHLLSDIEVTCSIHSIRPTGLLSQTKVIKKIITYK